MKNLNFIETIKEILSLFKLEASQNFHIKVLQVLSDILSMENVFDIKDFITQITGSYYFFQKIFKDCSTIRVIEHQNEAILKIPNDLLIIPKNTAQHPKFSEEIYVLLKKIIKQFFLDKDKTVTNQIYSISLILGSIINSLINEPIYLNECYYYPYNFKVFHYIGDILWYLIPNSDIARDFSVLERICQRLTKDLEIIDQNKKIYVPFCKENKEIEWNLLKKSVHIDYAAYLLKLLTSIFIRKISLR